MALFSRKTIVSLFCALALGSSIHALDFGGIFSNASKLYTNSWNPISLSQQDGLTAWIKCPLSADGKIYLAGEGTALFKFGADDITRLGEGSPSFHLDLGLLKMGYSLSIGDLLLEINAGRFFKSDGSGLIFSQTADGADLSFSGNIFSAGAFAFYTGLTNAHFVSMVSDAGVDEGTIYSFSSPYIVAGANVSFPYLFANQTVGAEFIAALGMKGIGSDNSGNNSFYATLLANGPIVTNLFYDFSTTLGFGDGVSNLTQLNLNFYPPVMNLSPSVSLGILYASGESGALKAFSGITSKAVSNAFSAADLSSVFKAGLSASVKPLDELFVGLGTGVLFDLTSDFAYSGFEWSLSAKYQIFTDLQVGLSLLQYYGADEYDNNSAMTLNVVLAF